MAEPTIATIEDILQAGEREVALPSLPGRSLRVRKVSRSEYRCLIPRHPNEAADWPKDDAGFRDTERRWLESLTDDQVEQRRLAFAELDFRLVALASVSPKLTVDDAKRLGEDIAMIAQAILTFSLPEKAETKPDAA